MSCDSKNSVQKSNPINGFPKYKIVSEMGDLINPIFQDTSNFVGLPGYIGINESQDKVCLIIGKSMSKDSKVEVDMVGSLVYKLNDDERLLYVGIPSNENYQSLKIDEQLTFNIDYNNLKLWIQDWIQYAYADKNVVFVGWN